jgi:hypothetical protein
MNAETILSSVREKYLNLEWYSDVGTASLVASRDREIPVEFKTYFGRQNQIRFEWRMWTPVIQDFSNNSICWNGKKAVSLFLGETTRADLTMAIAGATAVSGFAVLSILKLLKPDCANTNSQWFEMRNSRLIAEEHIGDFLCYHIKGDTIEPLNAEAWVDKKEFVIRRIRRSQPANASFSHREFNYAAVNVNVPLPEWLFSGISPQ